MIRENQRLLNGLNLFSDWALMWLMMLPAYALSPYINDSQDLAYDGQFYLLVGLSMATIHVVLFCIGGLYRSFRSQGLQSELIRLLQMQIIGSTTLMAALFFFRFEHFSRVQLAVYFALVFGSTAGKRILLRMLLRKMRSQGRNAKYVLIIGCGQAAVDYFDTIQRNTQLGYVISGYVGNARPGFSPHYLGGYDGLEHLLLERRFDEAIIALEPGEYVHLNQVVELCEASGTKFSIIPLGYKCLTRSPQIEVMDGFPMVSIRKVPLEYLGNSMIKRTFDMLVTGTLLLLLSPVMLLTAIGVKLSSPGPILFRQERVGFNGKPFYMLKFRSMRVNTTQQTGWSTQVDNRRTWFGSFIRKCSIDELPQLWNVLCGDMSLIGPRPELPHFVEQFRKEIPLYMVKHQVRPGITGWAQINGLRGDSSISERIRYDLYYLEHWSLGLDLKILVKTACLGFLNDEKLQPSATQTEESEEVQSEEDTVGTKS